MKEVTFAHVHCSNCLHTASLFEARPGLPKRDLHRGKERFSPPAVDACENLRLACHGGRRAEHIGASINEGLQSSLQMTASPSAMQARLFSTCNGTFCPAAPAAFPDGIAPRRRLPFLFSSNSPPTFENLQNECERGGSGKRPAAAEAGSKQLGGAAPATPAAATEWWKQGRGLGARGEERSARRSHSLRRRASRGGGPLRGRTSGCAKNTVSGAAGANCDGSAAALALHEYAASLCDHPQGGGHQGAGIARSQIASCMLAAADCHHCRLLPAAPLLATPSCLPEALAVMHAGYHA